MSGALTDSSSKQEQVCSTSGPRRNSCRNANHNLPTPQQLRKSAPWRGGVATQPHHCVGSTGWAVGTGEAAAGKG